MVHDLKEMIGLLIQDSAEIEYSVAKTYRFFSEHFPEDKDFWYQLYQEERGHANMLIAWKIITEPGMRTPVPIESTRLSMQRTIENLEKSLAKFRLNPPTRYEALQKALEIELDPNELHMNRLLTTNSKDPTGLVQKLQELHAQDRNHARRIMDYAKRYNFELPGYKLPQTSN